MATLNSGPPGHEKDGIAQEAAADASVVANDSPPTSTSQTSPTTEKASIPAGPPDGGLQAWLHILGSFFLYFNTWGE